MPIQFLNRVRGGSSRAFDSDVLAWRDQVVVNGGSVSLARLIIVDQFVFSEKASGAWALTDDYWGLWAENAAQALTSLKQRRLASAVNSPVFTADRDYTTDGAASHVDTGFVPVSHALVATGTNLRLSLYIRDTVLSTTAFAAGASATSSRSIRIKPRASSNGCSVEIGTGNTPSAHALPSPTALGYIAGSRDASAVGNYYGYKNGVAMALTANPLAFGTTLADASIFIGGSNSVGSLALPRATSMGFMSFGTTLSAGQEATRYSNVQAWATAVGAQV